MCNPGKALLVITVAATVLGSAEELRSTQIEGEVVKVGELLLVAYVKEGSSRHTAAHKAAGTLAIYDGFNIRLKQVVLPKSADAKKDATLTLHRPFWPKTDPETVKYEGKWTEDKIVAWAIKHAYPLIGEEYNRDAYGPISIGEAGYKASVIVLINETQDESRVEKIRADLDPILRPLVPSFDKWRFTYGYVSKTEPFDLEMCLGGQEAPDVAVCVLWGNRRYVLSSLDVADPDSLEEFLIGVAQEKIPPTFRSAPIPVPDQDEMGVHTLVGSTFEKMISDPKKDVLVLFTATGNTSCPGCAPVEVEWTKLAQKAKRLKKKRVLLAKIDTSSNECVEDVSRIPLLVLYPAVAVQRMMERRVRYQGAVDVESLLKFIKKQSRNMEEDDEL